MVERICGHQSGNRQIKTLFVSDEVKYTGEQLRPHWTYENFDLEGDSIVAFVGPCEVGPDRMVNLVDLKKGERIYSRRMLHFIVEHFDLDLERTLLRQRLLVCILEEKINHRLRGNVVQRWGDDLFDGGWKLSASVATSTPVSTMIHVGVNVTSEGTPVKTRGLVDYGLDPKELAEAVMDQYTVEMESLRSARCTVRGVK